MVADFSWKSVERAARLSVPHVMLFLMTALSMAAVPVPGAGIVKPFFVLMHVYYWSVNRPRLVPPALCFFTGLAMDILSGGALGVNAIILVAAQWTTQAQRRFLTAQPFITLWAVFGLIALAAGGAQWALTGLAGMNWPPPAPGIVSVAATFFLFPFAALLLGAVHHILPVAHRKLS